MSDATTTLNGSLGVQSDGANCKNRRNRGLTVSARGILSKMNLSLFCVSNVFSGLYHSPEIQMVPRH